MLGLASAKAGQICDRYRTAPPELALLASMATLPSNQSPFQWSRYLDCYSNLIYKSIYIGAGALVFEIHLNQLDLMNASTKGFNQLFRKLDGALSKAPKYRANNGIISFTHR